jgi:predicted RNase H-like HicB family nuclease
MKPVVTKTKTPAEYLREPYARVLIPDEDGGFTAEILEFPGCVSEGDSAEEALANLEEAATNWIETTLEQDQNIPEPYANYGYGGKVALRLPRSLHRKASQLAERDKVSLNTFLVEAVAAKVASRELSDDLRSEVKQLLEEMEHRLTKQTAQHGWKLASSLVGLFDENATARPFGGMLPRQFYNRLQFSVESLSAGESEASLSELLSQIKRQL